MRKMFLLCCLTLLSIVGVNAQDLSIKVDSVGFLPPTICRVSTVAGAYLLTPEDKSSTLRYAPANLASLYQKEGVLVLVSGVIGAIPPNVRMIGTPLSVRTIEFAESVTGGVKPSTGGVKPPVPSNTTDDNLLNIEYRIPLKDVKGTVRKMMGEQYVIEAGSTRYLPDHIADDLKVDGMRVRFWGKAGKAPANARLLGTPVQISNMIKDKSKPMKVSPPKKPTPPTKVTPPKTMEK